jgi:hypothetical protein
MPVSSDFGLGEDRHALGVRRRFEFAGAFHGFFETILGLKRGNQNQILLDIEHRAANSKCDLPIFLSVDANGIQYSTLTTTVASCVNVSTLEADILNCVQSRHFPITLEEISNKISQGIPEVRNSIFHLIKRGLIGFTKKGYVRIAH